MATQKHRGRSRALRPMAEGLEARQLLSGTVSGMNTEGDRWTLTLHGAGKIQVIKQPDASGSPAALDSNTEIQTILLSGTNPTNSRLTQKVVKASGGVGKVYFQNLTEQSNVSSRSGGGLGILSVNIPDFYLANTEAAPSTTSTSPKASITIPNGVNSLRFGGADTTVSFATSSASSLGANATSDQFLIRLGVPYQNGTAVIVNTVTSNGQAAVASTTGTANSPTQDSVVFQVGGRLNLFQANAINGNTTVAPTTAGFTGGTIVSSLPDTTTGLTGGIGFVRVGGNATNFSVLTNTSIANLYVGGETNNVAILGPVGVRSLFFGKGADTTTVLANTISSLKANRGMLNSRVVSERTIGDLRVGGDVVNSTILAGYAQGLTGITSSVANNIAEFGTYYTSAVTIPTPVAQSGGTITAYVSGDVTNSVFASSDNPISQVADDTTQTFGNPADAFLPNGRITARVEGSIDNSTATPDMPTRAFYAKAVRLTRGPVSPPNVPEQPLPRPATPVTVLGIPRVFPNVNGSLTTAPLSRQNGKS